MKIRCILRKWLGIEELVDAQIRMDGIVKVLINGKTVFKGTVDSVETNDTVWESKAELILRIKAKDRGVKDVTKD